MAEYTETAADYLGDAGFRRAFDTVDAHFVHCELDEYDTTEGSHVVVCSGFDDVPESARSEQLISSALYADFDAGVLYLRPYNLTSQGATEFISIAQRFFNGEITSVEQLEALQHIDRLRRVAEFIGDDALTSVRSELDNAARQITEYEASLAAARQTQRAKQRQLDSLVESAGTDAADHLVEQYQMILASPLVEKAEVTFDDTYSRLTVTTTDEIRITRSDTGESRWMGRFKISFSLASARPSITIENLSTKRGGRDHPHVANGSPCLGSHTEDLYEMAARREYFLLFDSLIQYLQTLNIHDEWGRYGAYWFDRPDERPLDTPETAEVAA